MEPDDDFSPDEMKAYGTQQRLPASSPVKEISQPGTGDEDFTPDQMKSYGVHQETPHSQPLPSPVQDVNKELDDIFSQTLQELGAHAAHGLDTAIMQNEVSTAAWNGADEKTLKAIITKHEFAQKPVEDRTQIGAFLAPVAEMLGGIGDTLATAGITAGGGAAAGSVVPVVGTGTGAATGLTAGLIFNSGKLGYGEMLPTLMKEGVPYETAKKYATVYGIANAALARFGASSLLQTGVKAMAKQTIAEATKQYLKSAGINFLDAEAIAIVNTITKVIAEAQHNITAPEDLGKRLTDGLKNSITAGLLGPAVAAGSGKILGAVLPKEKGFTTQHTEPKDLVEAAAGFDDLIHGPFREKYTGELPDNTPASVRAAHDKIVAHEFEVDQIKEEIETLESMGAEDGSVEQAHADLQKARKALGDARRDKKRVELREKKKEVKDATKRRDEALRHATEKQEALKRAEDQLADREKEAKKVVGREELPVDQFKVRKAQAKVDELKAAYDDAVELQKQHEQAAEAKHAEIKELEDNIESLEKRAEVTNDEARMAKKVAQEDAEKRYAEQLKKDAKKAEDRLKAAQIALRNGREAAAQLDETVAIQKEAVRKLSGKVEAAEEALDAAKIPETKTAAQPGKLDVELAQSKVRNLKTEVRAAVEDLRGASSELKRLAGQAEKQHKTIFEAAKNKLDRVLAAIKPKDGKSQFDAPTQKELDIYKHTIQKMDESDRAHVIDAHEKALLQHLSDPANSLANIPEHIQELQHRAEIAKQVEAAMSHEDPGMVRDLADHIQEIANGSKQSKLARLEIEKQGNRERNQKWLDATATDRKGNKLDVSDEQAQLGATFKADENPATWLKRYGAMVFDLGGKLRTVIQDLDPKQAQVMVDELGIEQAVKNAENAHAHYLGEAMRIIREKTGKSQKEVYKLVQKLDKEIDVSYVDGNGVERQFGKVQANGKVKKGTVGEALDAYMRMKEEALKAGIKDQNKLTYEDTHGADSTQARLKDALGEDNLKLGDALLEFYKGYGKRLGDKYTEVTGLELLLSEDYSGPTTRLASGAEKTAPDAFETNLIKSGMANRYTAGKTGSTIAKVENALGVKFDNPFRTLNKHIAETEQFINLHDTSKKVNALFGANNVSQRRAISAKFGTPMVRAIDAHLTETFKGAGSRANLNNEIFDSILRGSGVVMLGGKPQSILKQATGIISFAHYVNPKDLVKYSAEFWANAGSNTKMLMEKSPSLKKRYEDYLTTQIGTKTGTNLDMNKFQDFAMSGMKLGDKMATLPGMYAVYKDALKRGLSEDKAIHLAEEAFTQTQASSRIDQVSNFSRSSVGKPFGAFQQQQMRVAQIEAEAWRNAVNHGGEYWKDAIKASVVNRVAQGAFAAVDAALIHTLKETTGAYTDQDVDNAWWDAGRNMLVGSTIPIAGSVAHYMATLGQRKISRAVEESTDGAIHSSNSKPFAPNNLIESAAENAALLAKDAIDVTEKGLDTETVLNMLVHWDRSGNLVTTKIPYGAAARFAKKYVKNYTESEQDE